MEVAMNLDQQYRLLTHRCPLLQVLEEKGEEEEEEGKGETMAHVIC